MMDSTPVSDGESANGDEIQNPIAEQEREESYTPTYLEAFPPLPVPASIEQISSNTEQSKKMQPLKSTIMTQIFHIPFSDRRFKDVGQVGEDQAKVCQDIIRRSGSHLEVSLAKDGGLSILVTGTQLAVLRARKEILTRLQTQCVISLEIPKEHHRFMIGRSGERLRELELRSATRIAIPQPGDPSCRIEVSGSKEGVEKARAEILDISAEQDKRLVHRLTIEKIFHPFLSGPWGQTAARISEQTGTRINIPPPGVAKDELVLIGDKAGIAQAEAQIHAICEEKKQTMKMIAVEVGKSQHRYVTGPRGRSVQEIFEETGVWVEMPPLDSASETVTLRGDLDNLGLALAHVYAKANSFVVKEVSAPCWLHRFLIGKKGQKISEFSHNYPQVHIEFSEGQDRIELEGPVEEVCLAQTQLQELVNELRQRLDFKEIDVDPKFHRHLIGKNGSNINRIKDLHKVMVYFPQDGERSSRIQIEGSPEGVREAERDLLETVSRLECESTKHLIVEQKLHRLLIGNKGENIKEVREKFPEVSITFPDVAETSDIVSLRGPRDNVQKCAKFLEKQIAELAETNYSLSVPVVKAFHKNIIGKGGANIKKIREETGTRIELPLESSHSEEIVIRGRRDDCLQAREKVLQIQREQERVTEVQVRVDPRHHSHFVSRRGQVVRELTAEFRGVTISFPRTGMRSDLVTVRGTRDSVEGVRERIEEIVRTLDSQVSVECEIPQRFHRLLLGPRGTRIQQLSRDHNVQIRFPDRTVTASGSSEVPSSGQEEHKGDSETESRRADTIILLGREEDCRRVEASLKAFVPVSIEVDVPNHFHRFIIGQRGSNIRKMMDEYNVTISVPSPELKQDTIQITGHSPGVEEAERALRQRVQEIQAQQEDRVLRSFQVSISVDAKHHPKIIGRKGAVITQIRKDHDVNIQLPDRTSEQPDVITISGYEKNVEAAKSQILGMIQGFEDACTKEISLDPRVRARIIGARGKNIRKVMDDYKVEIQFPQSELGAAGPVTITGQLDAVEEAADHLLNLEEEYLMDVVDACPTPPPRPETSNVERTEIQGFSVRDAPWDMQQTPDLSSTDEFPAFSTVVSQKTPSVWGQRRF